MLIFFAAGCGGSSHQVSGVGLVSVQTPRFPVAGFHTYGTYPRTDDPRLRLVNTALDDAVAADQHEFMERARRGVARAAPAVVSSGYAGEYETELDRGLISASTTVVSMLLPRTREVLPARGLNDGWLGVTLEVPSGRRVRFGDLFRDGAAALRLARARASKMTRGQCALLGSPPFAVLPSRLVVGVPSHGSCYRFTVTIPDRDLRPLLSPLGKKLTADARWPSYDPDWKNLTYCRRPDLSGAELSASGEVACATARKVETAILSPPCVSRARCAAASFSCVGGWPDSHGTFEVTHHAICHSGRRRIVMDEG